jgi:hypothetical protein
MAEMTDTSTEFHTGQQAPVSGVYRFVRHLENSDCSPTEEEMEVPLRREERFPPHRHCRAGAAWQLVRRA